MVAGDIGNNALEETVSRAFSPIGHEVTHDDTHTCHRLENRVELFQNSKMLKLKRNIQIYQENL